eukprot:7952672-Prorocentrum_lima.AAC.1
MLLQLDKPMLPPTRKPHRSHLNLPLAHLPPALHPLLPTRAPCNHTWSSLPLLMPAHLRLL